MPLCPVRPLIFISKFWIGKILRQVWGNFEEIRIGTGAKYWLQIGL